jgi:hypothetical protein
MVRRNGNGKGLGGKGKKWMGGYDGSVIRRGWSGPEGVGVRCLVIVRTLLIEIRGDCSGLPLHECDPNLGVRR